MKIKIFLTIGCAALALAACKKDFSNTSDAQLLSLLGTGSNPVIISKSIQECVEVVSGTNAKIYQDMPAEMLGMMKTDCRMKFSKRLDDKSKNTTALTLDDFDRPELAERVLKLAAVQAAAERKAQADKRAAQLDELKAELKSTRAAGDELKARLAQKTAEVKEICVKLTAMRAELKQKDRFNAMFSRSLPGACQGQPLWMANTSLRNFEDRLSKFKLPNDNAMFFGSVPKIPNIDFQEIDAALEKLKKEKDAYSAALAGQ